MSFAISVSARTVKGYVVSSDRQPLKDAVVSCPGQPQVVTAEDGSFTLEAASDAVLQIWADGYYSKSVAVNDRAELTIVLNSQTTYKYTETMLLPFRTEENPDNEQGRNLSKKDFYLGAAGIDRAIQGEFAGLQVTGKSGMPNEGSYMSLHGIQTLVADAAPLVVINGVPYMPAADESQLIGGFSRSFFQSYNLNDIQNITLLTGAEASLYGSMGSNGVLLIETDGASSDDMDTKISYNGSFGFKWNNKRIPLMQSSQYKSYLSDMGMTYYDNMETFFSNFPFLSPDASDAFNYLYRFDTDWQSELYRNALTTEHLVRVEGGDAIAKYDMSVGYTHDEGVLNNTSNDRFNAQINSNVIVSKQFEIGTSIGLAYLNGTYQEQGLSLETNPMLAAYRRAPVLSPYKSDMYGNLLDSYASYNFGNNTNTDFIVSNPTSIIHTLSADMRQYDVNIQANLNYKPTNYLTFSGLIGLYYNYNQEGIFIPGINNSDIVPQFDTFGESRNTVRQGLSETSNLFYMLNAAYHRTFDGIHTVDARLGGQVLMTSFETDMGVGRNTANDFYQTLSDVQNVGRYFSGYGSKWNWVNAYLHLGYTYANLAAFGLNIATDGASSTGVNTARMGFFPSASATLMLGNAGFMQDVKAVSRLNIFADFGKSGNSRFSSNYGRYYYVSQLYQGIAGIVRNNVPNTEIKWEENLKANVGVDADFWHNRLGLRAAWYNNHATDVLVARTESPLYGTGMHYSNDAVIDSKGIDLALRISPVYRPSFKWTLGGNLSTLHNKVVSLGTSKQLINTLADGATLLTEVGGDPYSFYGYKVNSEGGTSVYSTVVEAKEAAMKNRNGVAFEAGDIRYVDSNGDHVIDDQDRFVLGSATPDFYGSLFNRFQYKGLALDFNFIYSVGNEAYNAVRRITESSYDFSNQSTAVNRRWAIDGQLTDMPRANYNDLVGNNDFSERWIEDASYLKLRDVTLSYTFDRPFLNFFQGGTIYLSGQNLLCFTHYLGGDPEFSYSENPMMQGVDYAKVPLPKTLKFGVNLKF